jgi:hypothetical protein
MELFTPKTLLMVNDFGSCFFLTGTQILMFNELEYLSSDNLINLFKRERLAN